MHIELLSVTLYYKNLDLKNVKKIVLVWNKQDTIF